MRRAVFIGAPLVAFRLSHFLEHRHTASAHPLGDEDIPGCVEGGIVRMHEAAGLPFFRLDADGFFARFHRPRHFFPPGRVFFGLFTEVNDGLIVLVEQAHPAVQIGDEQFFASRFGVGGEKHDFVRFGSRDGFTVERKSLQSMVRPIADDDHRMVFISVVNPVSVRRGELPQALARSAMAGRATEAA